MSLQLFSDFYTDYTGPAYFDSQNAITNDAMLRNYGGLDLLSRAKIDMQGGNEMKANVLLDTSNDAVNYAPGEAADIEITNHANTITIPWRFTRVPIAFNDKETALNEGATNAGYVYSQYKKLADAREQEKVTGLLNKMERNLLQAASTDMVAANGKTPYSIFAFITPDGLAPSGFTTVAGIDPSAKTKWRNQTGTYTYSTPFHQTTGLFAGFDNMAQLTTFMGPKVSAPNVSKKDFTATDFKNLVVGTNREGQRLYMQALRAANDITRAGANDPSYNPTYRGVDIKNIEGFDDQSTFTSGQPGFIFMNGDVMKIACYTKKWFKKEGPFTFGDKPDVRVWWIDIWWNLTIQSRQRQGYLRAA